MNKLFNKRLLFVIDNLNMGGAQRQIVNLAIGLANHGHLIDFFCYTPGAQLEKSLNKSGIHVHWSLKAGRFSLDIFSNLRKLIKRNKYDLVLSYLTTPNFYATIVTQFLISPRIPVIVSERRIDLPGGAESVEKLSRQVYRFSSHLITNSYSQQTILISKYSWLKNKISTIYNGLDLESFSPPLEEPNNNTIKILAIASVVSHKNVECLMQAIEILQKRDCLYPIVNWVGRKIIQGEGSAFLEHLEDKIRSNNLSQQWHWLDLREDIIELLKSHDVFVHPSFVEGLPNVVCEALACGRPVIVSNTLDHAKLVQDGKSGYLFDPHNPFDLADKIKKFTELPSANRKEMGQAGRRFAEKNLSIERLVNDYESLFLHLLKE